VRGGPKNVSVLRDALLEAVKQRLQQEKRIPAPEKQALLVAKAALESWKP
jgi:hypothetical protein